jgi:hypothetical protein
MQSERVVPAGAPVIDRGQRVGHAAANRATARTTGDLHRFTSGPGGPPRFRCAGAPRGESRSVAGAADASPLVDIHTLFQVVTPLTTPSMARAPWRIAMPTCS